MMSAEAGSRMEVIVLAVLCIGLLGYLMNLTFSRLARHLLRWRNTVEHRLMTMTALPQARWAAPHADRRPGDPRPEQAVPHRRPHPAGARRHRPEGRPGEFVSIVGASGCGKSTLLRLIVGLENDYEGEILLDGQRIAATSLERGIVFQDHRLFPG